MSDVNLWLLQKRAALVGDNYFKPESYGHLLWYWGQISQKELSFLEEYGVLRREFRASQGNIAMLTYSHSLYREKNRRWSEKECIRIKHKWNKMSSRFTAEEIALFDWLTQDPISYNHTRQEVLKIFNKLKSGNFGVESRRSCEQN